MQVLSINSSSFLWSIFRILEGHPKKELLRGLWVTPRSPVLFLAGLLSLKPYINRIVVLTRQLTL